LSVCEHAAIVGLGLMGGSLARDLHARGVRVSAYDTNDANLGAAVREGIVDHALDASLVGASDTDVVVIAVPVDAAIDVLTRVAALDPRATLITDVGSTKQRIVDTARSLGLGSRFVGSHPLAGDHRSGWNASRAGLFAGARVYLCPPAGGACDAIELAATLWGELGAVTTVVAADDHDRTLAWTSHLPHVVSTALALALARGGVRREDLGPGGRDVTRLAGSSPDMWTAIVRENAGAIDAALAATEGEIAALRAALSRVQDAEVRECFTAARAWFDA